MSFVFTLALLYIPLGNYDIAKEQKKKVLQVAYVARTLNSISFCSKKNWNTVENLNIDVARYVRHLKCDINKI